MRIDADALEPGQVVRASFDERVGSGSNELMLDAPVTGRLEITRTPLSLHLRGTVGTIATVVCSRCLMEIGRPLTAAFEEELELDTLDVTEVVRQHLLLAAPMAPLCRPDCQGICPECGANRNEADCGHASRPSDPRWAPLAQLKIDDRQP